jgi:hypothetical protein
MGATYGAHARCPWFGVPLTPKGDRSQMSSGAPLVAPSGISGASSGSSRKPSLVEQPTYRWKNLAENNICMCSSHEQFPEHIAKLVDHVRKNRDPSSLSVEDVRNDMDLEALELSINETAVEDYFKRTVFVKSRALNSLRQIDKYQLVKQIVPNVKSKLKVSNPMPDMLYEYKSIEAFPQQQGQLRSMRKEMIANSQGLIYPF